MYIGHEFHSHGTATLPGMQSRVPPWATSGSLSATDELEQLRRRHPIHVLELVMRVLEIGHHLFANGSASASIDARVAPILPAVSIVGLAGVRPVPGSPS